MRFPFLELQSNYRRNTKHIYPVTVFQNKDPPIIQRSLLNQRIRTKIFIYNRR